MKADLELTLTFDGSKWTAHNEALIAIGESFETLDLELTRTIRSTGSFPQGSRVKVFMGFDGKPCGYNNRFFNRRVDINV